MLGDTTAFKRGVQTDTFTALGAAVRRQTPQPEFLLMLGDHFWGNGWDEQTLRTQWQEWFDAAKTYGELPIFHLTGNHTCLDETSARVFRDVVIPLLPPGAETAPNGMGFVWRDKDLVLVVANEIFGLGGTEGRVNWRWVDAALTRNSDARFKLVASHYPVFPVNGYRQPCWRIAQADAGPLWKVLVKHRVSAYLCAHIIAFDVQIHQGIPQVCSGGAGFPGLYPPQTEYFHVTQLAINSSGLTWQTLDTEGVVRENGAWPLDCPPVESWLPVKANGTDIEHIHRGGQRASHGGDVLLLHFEGRNAPVSFDDQTLLTGWSDSSAPVALWIGLQAGRLEVRLGPKGGDPQLLWRGPVVAGQTFSFDIALHTGLGPGGVLFRTQKTDPWTSLPTDSAQGFAQMPWPGRWSVGMGHAAYNRIAGGEGKMVEIADPFRGSALQVRAHLFRV